MQNKHLDDKIKHFEYTRFRLLRLISISIIGLMVAAVFISIYFVYQNIFSTINQAHSILLFSDEAGTELIDLTAYNKVKSAWDKKHAPDKGQPSRDIFGSVVAPVTPQSQSASVSL